MDPAVDVPLAAAPAAPAAAVDVLPAVAAVGVDEPTTCSEPSEPIAKEPTHTYKFDVAMTCGGCSGAVTRALEKAKQNGIVASFDVSLEKNEVVVESTISYEDAVAIIKKTGKTIRSGLTVE